MMDTYKSYEHLLRNEKKGKDYFIEIFKNVNSNIVVVAPHGGKIEFKTTEIAKAIASEYFSYYSFNGIKRSDNRTLHITSHNFDEPNCLGLVEGHDLVVGIHGCRQDGEVIFIGGLNTILINKLALELQGNGFNVSTSGHSFMRSNPMNICNRGRLRAGIQFELTKDFRMGTSIELFVSIVQKVLIESNKKGEDT